jgi:hypothetical protein
MFKNFLPVVAAGCLFISSMLAPSAGHAQTQGPSGGPGGGAFADLWDPFRVARVTIRSGAYVDSVQITHERPDGSLVTFDHHGGFGGGEQNLDLLANEHIVRVNGRFGAYIDHITILTNFGRFITGGGGGGAVDFSFDAPAGFEIEGFIGRSGIYVDAIGVILRQIN